MNFSKLSIVICCAIVVIMLQAENFIVQKKSPKQPKLKQEDIIARQESVLQCSANLIETIAQSQKSWVSDVREVIEQPKNSKLFSPEHDRELQKLCEAMKICNETIQKIQKKIITRSF